MDRKINYLPVTDMVVQSTKKPLKQGSLKESTVPLATTFECQSSYQRRDISPDTNLSHGVKAKVICHSPQVIHSNINASKSSRPEKISMDLPPSLGITSETSVDKSSSSDTGSHSSSLQLCSGSNSDTQMYSSSTARPVYGDGCPVGLKSINLLGDETAKKSVIKVPQLTTEVGVTSINTSAKPKKKLPQSVASRYLSTHAHSSKQASNWNNTAQSSKLLDTSMRPTKSALYKPKSGKQRDIPKPTFSDISQTTQLKDQKREAQLKEVASTPAAGFKTFFESDMSTIQRDTAAKLFKKPETIKKHQNITQPGLHIAYSDYILQAYVKCAMEKTAKTRYNEALSDIKKLNNANVKLQDEVAELEDEVKFLEHEREMNELLDAQISMISPVVNKLSAVQSTYKEMVENVDTTRHHLATKDSVVPSEEHLTLSLQQTHNVLCDITTLTHTHAHSCADAAKHSTQVEQLITHEKDSTKQAEKQAVKFAKLSCEEAHLTLQLETEKMFSKK